MRLPTGEAPVQSVEVEHLPTDQLQPLQDIVKAKVAGPVTASSCLLVPSLLSAKSGETAA